MSDIPTITRVTQVKAALQKSGVCIGKVKPSDYHVWKGELQNCISKSGLVEFMRDPYAYHWAQVNGEKKDTPALRRGALIDTLVLTPELMPELYAVEEINRRTNAGRERAAELEAQGKTVLSPDEYNEAARVAALVNRHLLRGMPQQERYAQVAVWQRFATYDGEKLAVPLTVCGMLDLLWYRPQRSKDYIIDLKTTSCDLKSDFELQKNISAYKYGLQAVLYERLYAAAMGRMAHFNLFFVNTGEPYRVREAILTSEEEERCRVELKEALVSYAEAVSSEYWGKAEIEPYAYTRSSWECLDFAEKHPIQQ